MTRTALWVALAATMSLAAGCDITGPDARDDLEAARERWESANIVDYRYTLDRQCFCAVFGPKRIVVRGGQVESVTDVATGDPVQADESLYPSLDGLFDFLAGAVREADEITGTYDPDVGLPLTVAIDFLKNAIDDELTLVVSDFAVLAGS